MIDKPSLGGGQAALLSLASHLDRERFEVFVGANERGPLADEACNLGLGYLPLPFGKKPGLSAVRKISRALRDSGIEILHTHGGVAGLFGRLAAGRKHRPVVVHTLHGIHYLHYRNKLLRFLYVRLERYLSRRTDAVIFVSEADFQAGRRYSLAPAAKSVLIKNGIDLSRFRETESLEKATKELRWKLKLEPPIVGTVARLHRQKGIIFLLRAAAEIHRSAPQAKIVVVGGGPQEQSLRKNAQELGLDRFFIMLGERTDARELLSLFDVFVLPSLWEGLPLVVLEAAAWGKPMVATDIDGVREVLRNGETGLLVPPANPAKLAQAVLRLLENKNYASGLGERARTTIPPRFQLSAMVEQTQTLYLKLSGASLNQ